MSTEDLVFHALLAGLKTALEEDPEAAEQGVFEVEARLGAFRAHEPWGKGFGKGKGGFGKNQGDSQADADAELLDLKKRGLNEAILDRRQKGEGKDGNKGKSSGKKKTPRLQVGKEIF